MLESLGICRKMAMAHIYKAPRIWDFQHETPLADRLELPVSKERGTHVNYSRDGPGF